MPKLFGLNLVPVLAASAAFYVVGFLWYGLIFEQAWMREAGVTAEALEGQSPIWMVGGAVITIMQVIALGLVLKWRAITAVGHSIVTGIVLWLLIAFPFTLYGFFYTPAHNWLLLFIDASHLLVGWAVATGLLALMKV
jgi:hypothetical protein